MKKSAEMSVILVLLVLLSVIKVDGFNLSPQPNYVFREPALNIYMNKVRSSLFGFSLNLRPGG